MSATELTVLLNGTVVGKVLRKGSNLSFRYEPSFRHHDAALPLSLSMPLTRAEHDHAAIDAFMWGLLPDNEAVLERWAKRFHVSSRSPFALLSHVGEDCAGAVQFAPPERVELLRSDGPLEARWLTEPEVAERLRVLGADHASARLPSDEGQFSLAGAQPKTALLLHDQRWGVPAGRTPTTHILKPPLPHLNGHLENEHICLALAAELGLPTARSEVRSFAGERAIVIERYDRVKIGRTLLRVHQEDLCQALSLPPWSKYQSEGGPSPAAIVALLRAHSSRPREDVATFVDTLLFNWAIASTDGHAKNYSLLLGARGQVRLAPLYDLGSALPYPDMDQRRLKLAMKLGGSYRIREITSRHIRELAAELDLDATTVRERARELIERLQEKTPVVCRRAQADGLSHPIVPLLSRALLDHTKRCAAALARP